ncbi:MAG: hypothetical protein A3E78_12270 [Alphaproteobacteria bacterium RIFCSPHIGHO2_12_FULL_63_12]|nr:MAG: hypothetical protein A3E78_12270 [Alphaproteobacteria bacterium RIFCSPHIGHO2_12_FULL_63_12]
MSDFQQDEHETPVVFRRWPKCRGGELGALFPAEPFDSEGYFCTSYVHVGQHGSADYYGCIADTRAATPAEYADLRAELEGPPFGYRLKIYHRATRAHHAARKAEARRLRERVA